MSDLKQAAQQMLDALDDLHPYQKPTDLYPRIDALRKALAAQRPHNQCGETCERAKLCAVCARELAQQAEPQWCSCDPTRCEGMGRCRWQAMKYVPPAQQAERKPLTDEEIVRCLVAAKCVGTVNMSYDDVLYYITRPSRAATWFARAVELAHGITEGQR